MSIVQSARDTSTLQSFLDCQAQTDPLAYRLETNDVGSSAQKTVISVAPVALEFNVTHVDVPRLGLLTDATLRVTFTVASGAITNTWGALGQLSLAELRTKTGAVLGTLWADQIVDWVQSSETGAYELWTGRRHLLNGPVTGNLAAGQHTALIPLPFSNLRRLHYLYTPWLEELEVVLHTTRLSDWVTQGTSLDKLEILWDFRELSREALQRRGWTYRCPTVTFQYDSYRETDAVIVSTDVRSAPVAHYSLEIPITCRYNVFRILLVMKSTMDTLSTLDVESVLRVRLFLGDNPVFDANGPMLLKHMVTPPYRHHSRGAAVFAIQFSSEPHHMPDAHSGQSGFLPLSESVAPRLIVDVDSAFVTEDVTFASVTHLFYKAQSVDGSSGQVRQSNMI